MTCTVEALTSGPVAMDAAVLKRLLNGQQVPEGEFMISIIAEKVTYGPVHISSTAPETPMQTSVAAVSFVVFSVVMLWFAAIMIRAYNDARIKK